MDAGCAGGTEDQVAVGDQNATGPREEVPEEGAVYQT
jgi:hypothetical protein